MPDYRLLLGYGIVLLVLGFGAWFVYEAYFDPDVPYLPAGSDALVLFVTGSMGACIQWALSTATAAMTGRQSDRAYRQGLYTPPPEK